MLSVEYLWTAANSNWHYIEVKVNPAEITKLTAYDSKNYYLTKILSPVLSPLKSFLFDFSPAAFAFLRSPNQK